VLSIDFDTSSTARAGGVHIIMTFMPEDDSENKQIEGRTCRQDDPGSARKILFAEDLEKEFGIEKGQIENTKANSGKDWNSFLLELRDKHQV
jgi:preprotein translocase subunit SecA